MDLQTVCFTAVKVMCMLLLSSGFGLGLVSLKCESKWEEYSEVKCTCMNEDMSQLYRAQWIVYSSNGISTINCQMSDTFLTGEPCSSASELSATMGGTGSVLTIPSVTVGMNEVWCVSSFAGLRIYELPVFARPVQPVCKVSTVISDHVVVMCYTTSVFPKGVCQFNIEGPLASMRDNLTGTVYTHETRNDGKYQTICGFGIPLNLVRDGQVNRFQVEITPGVSVVENSTAYSNWTDFQYVAASVLDFTINSRYKSVVTVPAGSPIVFTCFTGGFPLTNVSIIRTNTYSSNGRSIFQKPATHELNRTITEATCDDAGTYACTADNGDNDKSPGIKVEVERKLQFAPGNTVRYTVYRSDYQRTFGFTVYGCQRPNYFSLTHSTTPVSEKLYSTSFSYSHLTLHLPRLDKVLLFGHNSLKLTMRNAADEASLSLDVTYVDDLKTTTTRSYWDDTGDNRRDSESGSLNAAAAVGIVVACVLVIAVCIITIGCIRRNKNPTSRMMQRAEYSHTVNQETYGRYNSTPPVTVSPATRYILEEQTGRQNRVPDIIPTSSTPTAPPAEDTTTNGDIQAYRNFSPPPSYEMVTGNDGDEGLSTSYQDTNRRSGVTQPEVPPPSYESVQAALEPPPPPPPYTDRQISSTYV